jgi:hypothetical protein
LTAETRDILAAILTPSGLLGLIIQQYFQNKTRSREAQEAADAKKEAATAVRDQTIADTDLKRAEADKLSLDLALKMAEREDRLKDHLDLSAHQSTQKVLDKLDASTETINTKIADNTAITVETKVAAVSAFQEANCVNLKLMHIGVELRDKQQLSSAPSHTGAEARYAREKGTF